MHYTPADLQIQVVAVNVGSSDSSPSKVIGIPVSKRVVGKSLSSWLVVRVRRLNWRICAIVVLESAGGDTYSMVPISMGARPVVNFFFFFFFFGPVPSPGVLQGDPTAEPLVALW